MKMLREGSGRVSTYRVTYRYDGNIGDDYIQALNAQQAVDFAREYFAPDGAEIIDVAKVVNNWK